MSFKYVAAAATALSILAGAAYAQPAYKTDNDAGLFDAGGLYGPKLENGTDGFGDSMGMTNSNGIDRMPTASTRSTPEMSIQSPNGQSVVPDQRDDDYRLFNEFGNIPRG